ncbi:hypothetical protein N9C83_06255 [Opitutales bacterium]|nr:hypothetical protein [Opitutales bacterium]
MSKAIKVTGIVVEGHGVASGRSRTSPYKGGSLIRQLPYFEKLNIPLSDYFHGTINIDISPRAMELIAWDYEARETAWTDLIPPEDFFFSHCKITSGQKASDGMIYYPSPKTKVENFYNPNIVEILEPKIDSIETGGEVTLHLTPDHCSLT